jgi:hypothetical protein
MGGVAWSHFIENKKEKRKKPKRFLSLLSLCLFVGRDVGRNRET